MIAIAHQESVHQPSNAHDRFLVMLPLIRQQAHRAFRSHHPEARDELVQEVVANCYVAYARLVELSKQDLAYASSLSRYAIRQVRSGRRVGNRLNVRDATSVYAGVMRGLKVERLDVFDADRGEWREVLVEDKHAGPAETAAARIDTATWFQSLSRKKRRVAKTLATGEATSVAARKFKVSAARVSQLRQELERSWQAFQGELVAA